MPIHKTTVTKRNKCFMARYIVLVNILIFTYNLMWLCVKTSVFSGVDVVEGAGEGNSSV